ncbi:GSU2403 family nucleotidyltransferase fold protein [Roseomonas sp. CECT 9278]|uniref:GSU2403 family nucleotidyltransferase fold protein n=1 Tax=Roseomonas sp. CECT 9278 TaxID=2845823 RepID=UPI001E41AF8F|nr:GSU2403 family nucleotidyltransferase fold protein [Roseomonas sp. CECT 9278]CAH0143378.1 hypothetical protein ROS9278_00532 [Roseomonas sp. CECT 9278]
MVKQPVFNNLDAEQARQAVDCRQVFEALRAAEGELSRRFAGSMAWRTIHGKDYLYRRRGKVEKSLGPRSAETEAMETAFRAGRARADDLAQGLRERLERMAPVNVALRLGRVPNVVARVLRRLDEQGLLGPRIAVVGTNALFVYEAAAGVQFGSGLLATVDVDLALDARRSLTLAAELRPEGLLGLLRKVDRSFSIRRDGDFRAVNRDGFMVDLITAAPRDLRRRAPRARLGTAAEDLEAVEIGKLQWLVEAPRFASVAIAESGLPVRMVAADPRFFAAHKLWLAEREDREPEKRGRDRLQGEAVAGLLAGALSNLPVDDASLSQLPAALAVGLREAMMARLSGPVLEW